MQVTYHLAMAAGRDAANRRAEQAGRTSWSRADYNHAAKVVEQLLGKPESHPVQLSELVAKGIIRKSRARKVKS